MFSSKFNFCQLKLYSPPNDIDDFSMQVLFLHLNFSSRKTSFRIKNKYTDEGGKIKLVKLIFIFKRSLYLNETNKGLVYFDLFVFVKHKLALYLYDGLFNFFLYVKNKQILQYSYNFIFFNCARNKLSFFFKLRVCILFMLI